MNNNYIEYRPWGSFEILSESPDYKVKLIVILPGQSISKQYHNHRNETWTVIEGNLYAILPSSEQYLSIGNSIQINKGIIHKAINIDDKPVKFIEVQTGTYFGEDDIIRLDDIYGRM